jgi:uncharacterized protein (TIGR02270 family)
LHGFAGAAGPHRAGALTAWLLAAAPGDVHGLLKALPHDPVGERLRVCGAGWSGDPFYVPWLIKQAATPVLARVAGEALSLITGADLAALDLEATAPAGPATGPNDNPADDDVSLDEDESLPWPDPDRLAAWWQVNAGHFAPGGRHFVGQALSPGHAAAVLSTGTQRQRVLAADHLQLLKPGSRRFNTAAPSHRQQRLLATPA